MIPKGIHYTMGMREYHAWKLDKNNLKAGAISCSMLKSFAPNPYEWMLSPDFKPTDAMRKGSVYDAAVTDPDQLNAVIKECYGVSDDITVAPFPDFRSKDAQEWKKQATGDFISQNEYDKLMAEYEQVSNQIATNARSAAEQVYSHPIAGEIMRNAKFQVGVIGEIAGIPAKCLIDVLPNDGDCIYDYKTTALGLSDDEIRSTIGKYKYHFQGAFYKSLFNQVSTDQQCGRFGFIFQSTKTHEVRVVTLSDAALEEGRSEVAKAVAKFIGCTKNGIQSEYLTTTDSMDLMPYHIKNEIE